MIRRCRALLLAIALPVIAAAQTVVPYTTDTASYYLGSSVGTPTTSAQTQLPWTAGLKAELDSLLGAPLFQTSQLALVVYDLTADTVIYSHNPRLRLRPASTMKVLTAVAAIDRLGAGHTLRTTIHHDGRINGTRVLNGNLYVRGSLDPSLTEADIAAFAEAVKALNVDTVKGNVYADLSMKDDRVWGEGWCWDDNNPTLSPLLLSGKPRLMQRLAQLLRERGIAIAGTVGEQRIVPANATLIHACEHTVSDLLTRTLKNSDNLYAEALFYQTGHAAQGRVTSAKDAAKAEREFLAKLGLTADHYRIADGSGLSLYNHLTGWLEVMVLRHAYRNPQIFTHFYNALPIAGMDGTLSGRMRGTPAAGNVRAKTGSLESVSSLAGYCTAANGHHLCFAIINNGLQQKSDGRQFQDKVCNALCKKY